MPHKGYKQTEEHRKALTGKNNPNWKGGRSKTSRNYWWIYMPEHPFADRNNYIREHRYMAECILERFLEPEEMIHHIDGNSENNLPENLYLFANRGKHTGYHHLKNKPKLISNL